jgi:hypothetical protein
LAAANLFKSKIPSKIMNDTSQETTSQEPTDPPVTGPNSGDGAAFDPGLDVSQLMCEHDRIAAWIERIKTMTWCGGDGDCHALEFILDAFAAAKELDLSTLTIANRGKGGLVQLIQYVYRCAARCKHATRADIRAAIYKAISDSGVRTDGMAKIRTDAPEFYYDRRQHSFWHQTPTGIYQSVVGDRAASMLSESGMSGEREKDGSPSEIERNINAVVRENGVDVAMPLAGYPVGVHQVKDLSILVTRSFTLAEPLVDKEFCKWPHIRAIIDGLLNFGTLENPGQGYYFTHKLHCDRAALKAEILSGGLATLIAGMPDSGKTVLLRIIRKTLGGRSACAAGFLTEKTAFNADLAASECHFIDDGNPFTDRAARRRFANLIKSTVASDDVWVHGKGKDGFALPLYRRLFIVTNLDSLDAMPELEPSLLDKIMILLAKPFKMPADLSPLPPMSDIEGYKAFGDKLDAEQPYFDWWLDNFDFPECLEQRRFGTVPYKNPDLLARIKELGHADEVHFLVQMALFDVAAIVDEEDYHPTPAWRRAAATHALRDRTGVRELQGGAVEVEINVLLSMLSRIEPERARRLFNGPKSLGVCLAEVKRDHPKLYSSRRSDGRTYWKVLEDIRPGEQL